MKLQIRYEGDPVLRVKSVGVEKVTPKIRKLVDDMFETMYAAQGIGLAAPQVGVQLRVITVDVQTEGQRALALINPEIVALRGEQEYLEGCLSCPGLNGLVKRAAWVEVHALDPRGRTVKMEAEGLPATVIQHEIDHLDGILFIDRLEPTERVKVEQQRSALRA